MRFLFNVLFKGQRQPDDVDPTSASRHTKRTDAELYVPGFCDREQASSQDLNISTSIDLAGPHSTLI